MLLCAQSNNNVTLVPKSIMSEFGSSRIIMTNQTEIVRSEFKVLHAAGRVTSPIAEITGCDG